MRASTRWRRLVDGRLGEMERLRSGRAADAAGYWNERGRARRFAATVEIGNRDPLIGAVKQAARPGSTVLDVGAGTGRYSLALAPRVAEVVAVDASTAMLDVLRRQARRRRIGNIRCVLGRWEEVEVERADVAICSFVLPLVRDPLPFLRKLDRSARRRAFVTLNGASTDLLFEPLWRHFHGRPRRPGPTWLDAVAVVEELGIKPEVKMVEVPTRARHRDVAAAARAYRDQLLLPDTPEARRELRRILSAWMVEDGGGLRPPVRTVPIAVISWTPSPAP